jgi:hypothetical protein
MKTNQAENHGNQGHTNYTGNCLAFAIFDGSFSIPALDFLKNGIML